MKECDRFTWDVTNAVTWACSSFQVCVQAQLRGLGFYLFVFIATAAIAVLFALCGEKSAAGGSEKGTVASPWPGDGAGQPT